MEKQNLIEDLFAYFEIDEGRYYKSEETWKGFYKQELQKAFEYGVYWESIKKVNNLEKSFDKFYDMFHNTKLNEDETED